MQSFAAIELNETLMLIAVLSILLHSGNDIRTLPQMPMVARLVTPLYEKNHHLRLIMIDEPATAKPVTKETEYKRKRGVDSVYEIYTNARNLVHENSTIHDQLRRVPTDMQPKPLLGKLKGDRKL